MDLETYENKVEEVLNKGEYRLLSKDPTTTIEGRIYRALKKYSSTLSDAVRFRLTPHYSKPPHLYGLPKIHKEQMPLRPITSSRNSPTSELSKFLLEIIRPIQGNAASFVRNSAHFVDLLGGIEVETNDRLVSFDVESLYTNVPIGESLNIIRDKLSKDAAFSTRTTLPLDGVMELLEICLRNSYFQVKDRFYAQDEGLPMGSSLSPVIANIFMEWFEEHAIDASRCKPKLWLRYVDDTFIIWDKEEKALQEFLLHLNSFRPTIKFTMETEKDSALPFLDVLVKKVGGNLRTSVYRKPTHTGQYLHYESNHPATTKVGIIRSLYNRARTICRNDEDLKTEVDTIYKDLQQNGYPKKLISRTIQRTRPNQIRDEATTTTRLLPIPYIRGTSEQIRRIASKYNIRTAFRSSTTIRSVVSKTKPDGMVDTKNCVYRIPCECGDSYIGETKRPLEIRAKEHRSWTQRGEVSKSGIAEHAWHNGHNIHWSEAKILHKEQHWRKRKFVEAAFISQNQRIFSQPSVDIPNIWKPLLSGQCRI
ncbi:uncharacterized protein LOC126738416 [Anthonomus grandis grandis]|uniref:uncharacterized protein LOC126738416 n=1 Tax=Anthonomus grandis grandis TaxID=2921223 RepID=UPI002166ADF3|nr:uncharacterized protein LOC126738416 [Anthonomus grandis grandis]